MDVEYAIFTEIILGFEYYNQPGLFFKFNAEKSEIKELCVKIGEIQELKTKIELFKTVDKYWDQ